MSREQNTAANEALGAAVSSGDLEKLRGIFAENVKDHDPAPDQGPGPQGFIDFFTVMRTAFPDLKVNVDHSVQDDDNIAIAYRITGTHEGDFLGIAPTGKSIEARGVQIARFENGKIVERWGSSDELGLVKSLGATLDTGKGPLGRLVDKLAG